MGFYTNKSIQILNEAYYGKKPEFKEIEKLLEVIIDKCHTMFTIGDMAANDIANSIEVNKINRLFEKSFNMKEMNLIFYNALVAPSVDIMRMPFIGANAFTLPSMLTYFKEKNDITSTADLTCCVFVDTALVHNLDLSPQELMAIILHELGHCYNASLFALLNKTLPYILYIMKVPTLQGLLNLGTGLIINTFTVKLMPILTNFINELIERDAMFAQIFNNIRKLTLTFFGVMISVNPIFINILKNPEKLENLFNPRILFGYSDEKFADSFATAYGYGPETISVQRKFQLNEGNIIVNEIEKFPVLNIGIDFIRTTNLITISLIDEHPVAPIRMQAQINKLKRDLKDPNIPKNVRKELIANLNMMERYTDDILSNEDNLKKGRIFSLLYNKIMMDVFKGHLDIRELFELIKRHEV